MIVYLTNDEGFIYAYASFVIVDEETKLDDNGKYLFVNGAWIHSDYRGNGTLDKLIVKMFDKSNKTEYVYWSREGTGINSGLIPISKFLNKVDKNE